MSYIYICMNNLSPFKEDTKSTAKYSRLCFARCPRSSNYTCVSKKTFVYILFYYYHHMYHVEKILHLLFTETFFHLDKKHKKVKRLKAKCLKNISVLKVHVIYAGCHFSKTYITCIQL